EVGRMLFLVLDREEHLAEDGSLDRRNEPRHEVDTLERKRVTLFDGASENSLHAHEHVSRLLEKAEQDGIVGLLRADDRRTGLEARIVDGGHELAGEERPHRLADDVR